MSRKNIKVKNIPYTYKHKEVKMTSEKREWYEGATYHITARGHHRNDIFRDEEDFKIYLIILEEALLYFNNYNYEIIAYCLMDNHVHLLLKTEVQPPWRFIA